MQLSLGYGGPQRVMRLTALRSRFGLLGAVTLPPGDTMREQKAACPFCDWGNY